MTEIAEKAAPSVVKLEVLDGSGTDAGSGTGFFVSEDGRILTNAHVIEHASKVRVVLHDGRSMEALGVLARDVERDLALVQAEPGRYVPLALASSEGLRAGDEVVVLGSPHGFSGTLSAGIVSAVRRHGVDEGDGMGRYWKVQVTAPISPGSSGSPIMTPDGRVVAVAVGQTESGQALNFGVPIEDARVLLETPHGASVAPWTRSAAGRGIWLNLAISGVAFGVAALVLMLVTRLDRRRGAPLARPRVLEQ